MPIRNLTDKRRIPRLGKIHLGIKDKNARGTEYPRATDYFVCPPEVQAVHGEKPTELPIMFVSNDPDLVASQYYRSYKRSVGLVCKGDGYQATATLDADALKKSGGAIELGVWASHASKATVMQDIECLGEGYDGRPPCPAYAASECKRLMMLQFVILDVKGLGVYQLDTSSFHSIIAVNSFMDLLAGLTNGRISSIPLKLRLVPQEVSPDGKKKTVHVLQIDADFSMTELLEAARKPLAELLPPPPDGTEATEAEEPVVPPQPDDEIPADFFPAEAEEQTVPTATAKTTKAFGAFVDLHGKPDWKAFLNVANQRGLTTDDLARIAPPSDGGKLNLTAWLQAEPGRTLDGLLEEAARVKAQEGA